MERNQPPSVLFRKAAACPKKSIPSVALFLVVAVLLASTVSAQDLKPEAIRQIQSLLDEKESRTPAQKKISSAILYALKADGGKRLTPEVATLRTGVVKDAAGKIKVDIKAVVSTPLLNALQTIGAEIIFSSERFGNIVALIPLDKVEQVAAFDAIGHIEQWTAPLNNNPRSSGLDNYERTPGIDAGRLGTPFENNGTPAFGGKRTMDFATRSGNVRKQLRKALDGMNRYDKAAFAGSVTSEADATHKADQARAVFGVNGTGVKIGVLSDGVTGLASSQASGDLPPVVTILPGQAGNTGSEGRAMLELIYDLAPGADLYFATAFTSQASFAQNILDLRAAGCDIIVDDISYFAEGVFQDDNVAQAVNTVTASGALYFSSAGNSGNKNDGTAGVWEGDFTNGGASVAPLPTTGNLHAFSGTTVYNALTVNGRVTLKWSDPLGLSANDYDLFITNAAGTTVVASGTTVQDGNDNPYEDAGNCFAGERIYILKKTAALTRALHLNTNRGVLTFSTSGVVYGHNAAATAYTVAATPAAVAFSQAGSTTGPFPNPFNSSNKVEVFSSDGPRRIFYNPNGTQITPGNLLFGTNGGLVLAKPDITAADGTVTVTPGFTRFYGTSAAAPHAAAIAALIKSAVPGITPSQIRTALTSTAIDIETAGFDRDAGVGIIMAYEALASVGLSPVSNIELGTVTATEGAYGNGNGVPEPGELASMTVQLKNISTVTATGVTAVLSTSTPGVVITQNASDYGTITGSGSATNTATPYRFGISASVPCGSAINFSLTVNYGGGGPSPKTLNFVVYTGTVQGTITATLGSAPATGTGFTSTSGIQTNRTLRDGLASNCAAPKTAPGISTAPNLAYHAYVFTNTTTAAQCVTVRLSFPTANAVYAVAYTSAGYIPATPGVNYRADAGLSDAIQTFSFNAPAGQAFTVVVHQISSAVGNTGPYTLNVNLRSCAATPACTPIVVNPATLPDAVHNAPYSQSFSATGGSGSYTFSLTGTLPTGLSFTGNTLSGTPTQVGSFPITVTATDATGCPAGSRNYTLRVLPVLSINDVTKNEGNIGTTAFTFTVSLSANAPTGGVTFDIATANNTATTANNDYVAKSLTGQTIPAGSSSYTFDVSVNGDIIVEPNETFFVNVTNVNGASVSDGQGLGTITNDDAAPLPTLNINDVTQSEGNAGTTTFTFTVSLSAPAPAGGVTFNIATADNTATTANNDYVAKSLTGQTIAQGNTTYMFDVSVNGDVNVEPNESFFVNVSNVTGATVGDGQGVGTITNDDVAPLPLLTINDVSLNEGNSGATVFTFTVSLSAPAPAGGVSFNIATADNTATTANNDYAAKSLTGQTIAQGNTTYTFDVTVNGDGNVEPNESFLVNVTNVTNATVSDGQGVGTIVNDDMIISVTTYYPRTTATDLSQVSNWTTDPAGGAGSSPSNFTSPNQLFNVNGNVTKPNVLNAWTISGGSNLILNNVDSLIFRPAASLTIGMGSTADFNGKPVTLKSTPAGTAFIGQLTGTLTGATAVTVERYLSANNNRAYRLLTPSVNTAASVRTNWQEGQNNPTTAANSNTVPGYGTHVTGNGANGFDATQTGQGSLFTYNPLTPAWEYIPNTDVNTLNAKSGYLIYIRGGRDVNLNANAPYPSSNTTLRATGTLLTGNQAFPGLTGTGGPGGGFNLVTNPYASPISWPGIHGDAGNTGLSQFYTLLDPNVGGDQGGYVTVGTNGIKSDFSSNATVNIQSGQAFFVKAAGAAAPTLTVKEAHKSTQNNVDVFRAGNQTEVFASSLFFTNAQGIRTPADAVTSAYNNQFSAAVDENDADQIPNFDEDITIKRGTRELSIETRPLVDTRDTISFALARLQQGRPYEWQFNATNFNAPGLTAALVDGFTGLRTAISLTGTTVIPFAITGNPASSASDRFSVVFGPAVNAPLPVSGLSVKAHQKERDIQVEWRVQGEVNAEKYEVEKSGDARQFNKAATLAAQNTGGAVNYDWLDVNATNGSHYYRIKAVGKAGEVKYSSVVRVDIGKGAYGIAVYPNPTKDDAVSLSLNLPKGKYTVALTNALGQQVYKTEITHAGGGATQTLRPGGGLAQGVYQVTVSDGKSRYAQQVIKQ